MTEENILRVVHLIVVEFAVFTRATPEPCGSLGFNQNASSGVDAYLSLHVKWHTGVAFVSISVSRIVEVMI